MVEVAQTVRINREGTAVAFSGSRQICQNLRFGVLPTRKRNLNRYACSGRFLSGRPLRGIISETQCNTF